ncbi:MAG: S-adenosylmethionine synthetase, partial [Methanomethylovorans sp.]|nr:S-adenosylmethionine synthetase [Methanomethylovorans sp.]
MRNISVEAFNGKIAGERPLEIVERKGLGHPDSICDSIMEKVSVNLCTEYLQKFGAIMHHNVDKGLLIAGSVQGKFGGGNITSPMRLVFGDRATFRLEDIEVAVEDIAINTAKEWLRTNLRYVNPEDLIYQVELKPGSAELTDIFKRKGEVVVSNDTSAAVGYAPMSFTEKMVLNLEKHLNSPSFKRENPVSGEDVKIMAVRKGKDLQLTVAMPLIDYFVESEKDYFLIKGELFNCIQEYVADYVEQYEP